MNEMYHWISSFHHHIYKHEQYENRLSKKNHSTMKKFFQYSFLLFHMINVPKQFLEKMYKHMIQHQVYEQNMDLNEKKYMNRYQWTIVHSYFSTNWNHVVVFVIVFLDENFVVSMDHWHQILVHYSSQNTIHLSKTKGHWSNILFQSIEQTCVN